MVNFDGFMIKYFEFYKVEGIDGVLKIWFMFIMNVLKIILSFVVFEVFLQFYIFGEVYVGFVLLVGNCLVYKVCNLVILLCLIFIYLV